MVFLLLAGAAAHADTATSQRAARPPFCGVWGIWGGHKISNEGKPWYKGAVISTTWKEVEPQEGQYAWDKFDADVRQAVANGLSVIMLVYHGHQCPKWIFERGVPKVSAGGKTYGYYLDEDYKILLSRLIGKTAEHIAAYPPEIRLRIVGVQCPTGKSGDPQPYENEPDEERYRIKTQGPEWIAWTVGMFPVYYEAYKNFKPPVFLIFKGPNPEANEWLIEHYPDTWRKPHAVAQGYQFNNEMAYVPLLRPWTSGFKDGVTVRTRGEYDHSDTAWAKAAPVWNVYWTALWNLTHGIDIWNMLNQELEDPRHVPAFEFMSKYAGYKEPGNCPGAWCALRDGLDCMDAARFPEETFGPVQNGKNAARYAAIAQAMAAYGAREDDPAVVLNALDTKRKLRGLNDVGYNIWTGNYYMYLQQYAPNETSQGYWRVGPLEERFGRFARGFDHARGKDAMFFTFDDGFIPDQVPEGGHAANVRVVYFDAGSGEWALEYDSVENPQKRACTVKKENSGHWKEKKIFLHDARFGHRGPHGADLVLQNTDAEDDLFHMIEVTRVFELVKQRRIPTSSK